MTALAAVLLVLSSSSSACAAPVLDPPDRTEPTPAYLDGVGIQEHLSSPLPLGLEFRDESGATVHLADYFDEQHPVILTLNYSHCPMLCSLELNGLVNGLKDLKWTAGKEFRMVTVSLDPTETPDIARGTRQRYLRNYGRPEAAQGWHFLTGTDANIHALARAIGFGYRYDTKAKQYYHAAALVLATPKGTLARYLYGIRFTPETLRLGLVESSQGEIGTTIDALILYCCAYNPAEGSYAAVANRVMNLLAVAVLVALVAMLSILWLAEIRKKRRADALVHGGGGSKVTPEERRGGA